MPATGKYKVYLNGFTVHQQTWDHAFELDGKADEVYLTVASSLISGGNPAPLTPAQTATIGDTNGKSGRIQGGSARGGRGGLVSGDSFPKAEPWARGSDPVPQSLPMLVWTGELVQDRDVLAVMPSIVESDEGGPDVYNSLVDFASQAVDILAPSILELGGAGSAPYIAATQAGLLVLRGFRTVAGQAGDRPIGMRNGTYDQPIYTLDYDKAEQQLSNGGNYGPGVTEIAFLDSPDIGAGRYSLYVQVERA
jgi:hypothetical protein